MIRLISRLFAASPLSDSNRRPLPYHESGDDPLTGQIASIHRLFRRLRLEATPADLATSRRIWDSYAAPCPDDAPAPDDIRACFPDQNRAIAERLNGITR